MFCFATWKKYEMKKNDRCMCSMCGFILEPMDVNGELVYVMPKRCPDCRRFMKVSKSFK